MKTPFSTTFWRNRIINFAGRKHSAYRWRTLLLKCTSRTAYFGTRGRSSSASRPSEKGVHQPARSPVTSRGFESLWPPSLSRSSAKLVQDVFVDLILIPDKASLKSEKILNFWIRNFPDFSHWRFRMLWAEWRCQCTAWKQTVCFSFWQKHISLLVLSLTDVNRRTQESNLFILTCFGLLWFHFGAAIIGNGQLARKPCPTVILKRDPTGLAYTAFYEFCPTVLSAQCVTYTAFVFRFRSFFVRVDLPILRMP